VYIYVYILYIYIYIYICVCVCVCVCVCILLSHESSKSRSPVNVATVKILNILHSAVYVCACVCNLLTCRFCSLVHNEYEEIQNIFMKIFRIAALNFLTYADSTE
jgi:hypothetical protein